MSDVKDRLKELFRVLGQNKDGVVDCNEFARFFSQLSPAVSATHLTHVLSAANKDVNGMINMNEFIDWLYTEERKQCNGTLEAPCAQRVSESDAKVQPRSSRLGAGGGRLPHLYVVDAGSSGSRLSRMTLDPSSGLIQKKKIGEVGEDNGCASHFILGEMLKEMNKDERRKRFDSFLDNVQVMIAPLVAADLGLGASLGLTVVATAGVRNQFKQLDKMELDEGTVDKSKIECCKDEGSDSSNSGRLRAEFMGGDRAAVAEKLGLPAFDALVLESKMEALFEAKSALFALHQSRNPMKFDGLISAGGMSSQLVTFARMKPLSIDMAWKPILLHYLDRRGAVSAAEVGDGSLVAAPTNKTSEVESMKKKPVTDPEVVKTIREHWAERFQSSEERQKILALVADSGRSSQLTSSDGTEVAEGITGRWVFISGLVAFFGSLGLVPLERLGSDVPAADPSKVRAFFFGEKYGGSWTPTPTFRASEVRSFLETYFDKVPKIAAEGGIPKEYEKDKAMNKALSSASQYIRVGTAVHLEAIMSLFHDDAEIYFSKAETHPDTGNQIEYSVNVGYAMSILLQGVFQDVCDEGETEVADTDLSETAPDRPQLKELMVLADFQQFDKNSDGVISRAELEEMLMEQSKQEGGIEVSPAEVDRLWASIDVDGDGEVDYLEFVRNPEMQKTRQSRVATNGSHRFSG